jgi:hypothetical protein
LSQYHDIVGLALRTGPDLYPSVTLARESLGWIEAQSFVVLGFDGFTTDGEWLIPSLEHIADFSRLLDNRTDWDACVRESIEESRRVLGRWAGKIQFVDAVIASQGEDFSPN